MCMTNTIGISVSTCAPGAQLSQPTPSPPVGRTAIRLAADQGYAALQVAAGKQVEGACVCHAHTCVPCVRVGYGARCHGVFPMPVPQGSTK